MSCATISIPTDEGINPFEDVPLEFRLSTYSYDLPPEAVAQEPVSKRDHSRLLYIDRKTGTLEHRNFFELSQLLNGSDALVINETKVIPASLEARKRTGGIVRLLVLDPAEPQEPYDPTDLAYRNCMFKTSGHLRNGTIIEISDGIELMVENIVSPGRAWIKFPVKETGFLAFLDRFGVPPLPPYIRQKETPLVNNRERYQTIYSQNPGSIVAPTAGLHFTEDIFAKLASKGIKILKITLHVGPGTFVPIKTPDIRLHKMEPENYIITDSTAKALQECIEEGRRIIAVGSTCVRALEASYEPTIGFCSGTHTTRLFITPGYKFKVVGGMITNFHLPQSTLFALVCAFAGIEVMIKSYRIAISNNYRFYSYGDACLII